MLKCQQLLAFYHLLEKFHASVEHGKSFITSVPVLLLVTQSAEEEEFLYLPFDRSLRAQAIF